MAFLEKADLTSIVYLEDIDVITEGDDTKVTTAINTAITEASSYLGRFDIPTLFAATGDNRDPMLMECCKAIACWYLTKPCKANQSTKEINEGAQVARAWLKGVMQGDKQPYNWPPKPAPVGADTFFHLSSFAKRGNNY